MNAAQFHCPQCLGLFQTHPSMAGQAVHCPLCYAVVTLPPSTGMPAAPSPPTAAPHLSPPDWSAAGAPGYVPQPPAPQPPAPQPPDPHASVYAQLACPFCQGGFQLDLQFAGQQIQCPHCRQVVSTPPPEYFSPSTHAAAVPATPDPGAAVGTIPPAAGPLPESAESTAGTQSRQPPRDVLAVAAGAGEQPQSLGGSRTPRLEATQTSHDAELLPPSHQPSHQPSSDGKRRQQDERAGPTGRPSEDEPPRRSQASQSKANSTPSPRSGTAAPAGGAERSVKPPVEPQGLGAAEPSAERPAGSPPRQPAIQGAGREVLAPKAPGRSATEPPGESKPAESKSVESKSVESKSAESKSAESKPAESKPAESKSAEGKSAESKSAESKSAELAAPAEKVQHGGDAAEQADEFARELSAAAPVGGSASELPGSRQETTGTSGLQASAPEGEEDIDALLPPAVDSRGAMVAEAPELPPRAADPQAADDLDDLLPPEATELEHEPLPESTEDTIILPTEDGYVAVRKPVKTVGAGESAMELRELLPEERARRRFRKNLILWTFGLAVILVTLYVLLR